MKKIEAPAPMMEHGSFVSVFLAGSIDNGESANWQEHVIRKLEEENYDDQFLSVFNPRRLDFQVRRDTKITNEYFKEQVMWELTALEEATIIFMYLDPDGKSPVSLLELGLYADRANIILVCPDGYWRKGNVDIVAEVYDIPVFTGLFEGIEELKKQINYEDDFMNDKRYNG